MLKRTSVPNSDQVKVTFALPGDDPRLPAAVLGDFNQWDPEAHPMRPRSNGTWSAVVTLHRGKEYRFRYRSLSGEWFNDDQPDGYAENTYSTQDCVIRISARTSRRVS